MNEKNQVSCFLPCRKGSERIPNKNIRQFHSYQNGLIELKLNQLINSRFIKNIYLSTNDPEIINYAEKLHCNKIIIHRRLDSLSSSLTSTDSLIKHASQLVEEKHILWTHVTSPFINSNKYDELILKYFERIQSGFDSLMTVTKLYDFIWNKNGPVNYDRNIEKWPRTQTLQPLYKINSGAFISSRENYYNFNDRIGSKPYYFCLSEFESLDIDWPFDFSLAEFLMTQKECSLC